MPIRKLLPAFPPPGFWGKDKARVGARRPPGESEAMGPGLRTRACALAGHGGGQESHVETLHSHRRSPQGTLFTFSLTESGEKLPFF